VAEETETNDDRAMDADYCNGGVLHDPTTGKPISF
jgi:hypothetical protein